MGGGITPPTFAREKIRMARETYPTRRTIKSAIEFGFDSSFVCVRGIGSVWQSPHYMSIKLRK